MPSFAIPFFKQSLLLVSFVLTGFFTKAQDKQAPYAKWVGTYHSVLPCTDCEGMEYVLSLNKDRLFVEEIVYLGKSKTVFTTTGNYNVSPNGIMSLVRTNEGSKYFRKHPDGLRILDANAKIMEGEFASKYILTTVQNISGLEFITKKYAEGTDFYAFGNSDSWSLGLDFGKTLTFKTEKDSITALLSKADTSQDKKTINYIAKNDSLDFRIKIVKDSCRNRTSGERFAYQVSILSKKSREKGPIAFTGGGHFLPDQLLENVWEVTKIKKKKIKSSDFKNGIPRIEFNTKEKKIKGFSGCNNFEGKGNFEVNTMKIEMTPVTQNTCPNTKQEIAFYQMLNTVELTYKISNSYLKLFTGEKQVLELQIIQK